VWWYFSAARAAEAEWLRPAFLQYLRARGPEEADYGAAELVFGELVGNVVRHAAGEIAIRVDWRSGEQPILTVCDRGPGFQLRHALPKDLFAESGRGLFLVNVFADDLRVRPNPGGGSCVSVRLRIARAATGSIASSGQLGEQNSHTNMAVTEYGIATMRMPYAASSALLSSASSSTRSNS
jgi:anti-sigma regulatory factor (Ser/Thr protein kinase)